MRALDGFLGVCAAAAEGEGVGIGEVLVLGVGKAAAAATLAARCAVTRPRGVLLFGVAGAFPPRHGGSPALAPGAVCVVRDDVFGDEGVETPAGFVGIQELGLGSVGPFALSPLAAAVAEAIGAPLVSAVTVSTCSGSDRTSRAMAERSGAAIETMEGAAVAVVCARFEVPLVHVRAISNWTGDRDRGAWDLARAIAAVQGAVRRLLGAP
ncbi:MAG: futalosine hydrolase [Planctomycetota bacterium]